MRKMKLFPKTYLFTMGLMGIIILISHTLLYILLPQFYIRKKQDNLDNISKNLIEKLANSDENDGKKIANDFANRYKIDILLKIGDETNMFKGINQADVLIDPEQIEDESLSIFEVESNIEEGLDNNSNLIGNDSDYFRVKSSSILTKKTFKSLDGKTGEFRAVMDLQSVKEASGVVFMILPYSIVISLVISLLASYIYVKIITDPIKKICEVTKDMKSLKQDAYCDIETGDEIETLSLNINSLYKTLWNTIGSLKEEIDKVSKSEKSKVDFLRSASHELKTPLMSINIMLENMMMNIGKYKDHDTYLSKCMDVVDELSTMVQEILDTSRLGAKDNYNEYKVISLSEVVDNMIEPYKIIARSKHINMYIDYSNSFMVRTDEKLLTKALSNIISNAVNYTNEGENINVYFKEERFVIENQCTPIPREELEPIFEAFYRADFDRNKNSGGNGLGLYIVKQILVSMNIGYSFEATENGMRFTIDFRDINAVKGH